MRTVFYRSKRERTLRYFQGGVDLVTGFFRGFAVLYSGHSQETTKCPEGIGSGIWSYPSSHLRVAAIVFQGTILDLGVPGNHPDSGYSEEIQGG